LTTKHETDDKAPKPPDTNQRHPHHDEDEEEGDRIHSLCKNVVYIWKAYVKQRRAERHAQRALLLKSINAWKAFNIQTWRTGIKAELHHKFIVYGNIWRAWKEFVVVEKHERERENIAVSFGKSARSHHAITAI
jgi:hypothetical protein